MGEIGPRGKHFNPNRLRPYHKRSSCALHRDEMNFKIECGKQSEIEPESGNGRIMPASFLTLLMEKSIVLCTKT